MGQLGLHLTEATSNNMTRTVKMSAVLTNPTKEDARALLRFVGERKIEVNPGTGALLQAASIYGWQNAREQIHFEIVGQGNASDFEIELPILAKRYMILFVNEIDGNIWTGKVLTESGEYEFLATVSKAGDKVLSVEADGTLPKLVEQFIKGYLLK